MAEGFITKGSTVTLSVSGQDIKAVLVEDPDITVGEAENKKLTASDGTSYSFAGQEGDNALTMKCVAGTGTFAKLMSAVYGSGGSTGTTSTTWNLTAAGGTTQNITFVSPNTTDNQRISVVAHNAKGLVAKPIMELGSGWQLEVKFTCDKWSVTHDTNTTD